MLGRLKRTRKDVGATAFDEVRDYSPIAEVAKTQTEKFESIADLGECPRVDGSHEPTQVSAGRQGIVVNPNSLRTFGL